jgi:DNA-binding beta-propeller fold protein YncE
VDLVRIRRSACEAPHRVVNRQTENSVTVLAASDYSLVEQVGLGAGTNPQDVAVVGTKVYVATYAGKGLRVFTRGSSTTTEIDLSSDDPDGKPNCSSVYAVGTKVFVACQLADDTDPFFTPRGNCKVYVVDSATNTKTATLTMSTPNPFSLFAQLPAASDHAGDLVIGTVDFANSNSGCLERVTTGATPTAPGCLLTNTELGGFAQHLETSETTGYVVVARADFSGGDIRTFALSNSTLATGFINSLTHAIIDLAVCPSGKVVAMDKGSAAPGSKKGMRVYTGTGVSLTFDPMDITMTHASTWTLACYE